MRERVLRRRCRELLKQLDISPPLDVHELCRRVGVVRGKPIRLVAYPIPVPGPFGVWIATGSADYILYQQETSPSHQNHIILHELGHIIAGHSSDESDDVLLGELDTTPSLDVLRARIPELEPDAVRRALRRTSYDDEHERDAETVATIVLEWASVLDTVAPSRELHAAGRALQDALGDRSGWL